MRKLERIYERLVQPAPAPRCRAGAGLVSARAIAEVARLRRGDAWSSARRSRSFYVRARVLGRDRALAGSTQALALVPACSASTCAAPSSPATLARCHPSATIEFGTIFSKAGAIIDEQVYVGPALPSRAGAPRARRAAGRRRPRAERRAHPRDRRCRACRSASRKAR